MVVSLEEHLIFEMSDALVMVSKKLSKVLSSVQAGGQTYTLRNENGFPHAPSTGTPSTTPVRGGLR
jgi:hypothetical protein